MALADEFFDVTEEEVRERIFETIEALFPDPNLRPDLREGQLVWTLTAPTIKELLEFYSDLNDTLQLAFLQYTRGEYLDEKGVEIGLTRIAAEPSEGIIRLFGESGTVIPVGTTTSTTAEDEDDEVFQFDTNTFEEDGVTPYAVADRTIIANADPVELNEKQRISLLSPTVATGGNFDIEFNGDTTPVPIDYNDNASDVQTKLEVLPSIGAGNVLVTGGPLPFADVIVEFRNTLGEADQPLMASPADTLTPGTASVTITEEQKGTPAAPVALETVAAGNITGACQYKYTWVTVIGDERSDEFELGFGETAGSPASNIVNPSGQNVDVTVDATPATTGLNEVTQVKLYRSFNDGGGFSDYKLVKTADADQNNPIVITDDVPNIDFEVIEDLLEDVNTTGVVDISSTCIDTGAATNVATRTISLLDDAVFGVEKVTNPTFFSGGTDEETDDAYRARLLEEIQKPPGAGNIADYEGWAKSIAGVGGATVVPEWEVEFGGTNGPGTVKVVLSGVNNEQVNFTVIEDVRQYIAGDVALISPRDHFGTATPEYGITTTVTAAAGSVEAGDYEYVFTFANVGGGQTPHSGVKEDFTEDASMIVGPVTVASNGSKVTLNNIPVPGPTGVAVQNTLKRRIYRRTVGVTDDKFYLVGDIDDNTTTTFEDTVSTSAVGLRYAPVVNSTSLYNGQAPIGAHVTVESISEFSIKVHATIIPESGYNILGTGGNLNLGAAIRLALKNYIDALPAGSIVYFKDIENVIHDTAGVKDFRDVELETASGIVDEDTFPALVTPPSGSAKPIFDSTGVLTEAAV